MTNRSYYVGDPFVINEKKRRILEVQRQFILFGCFVLLIVFFLIGAFVIVADASSQEESTYKYYTSIDVAYGDTLWAIAETHYDEQHYESLEDYISEIIQINHLHTPDILKTGQVLIIPYF
jgi:nucleoid-associated protein YgaU